MLVELSSREAKLLQKAAAVAIAAKKPAMRCGRALGARSPSPTRSVVVRVAARGRAWPRVAARASDASDASDACDARERRAR
ncbi:hypothetical protein NLO72_25110, partial [Pseudomonas tremae]|uniref:hypothetical protein n=1 Tax=Pseudomonas tremae TaxID=200454 RepID=UPI00210B8556